MKTYMVNLEIQNYRSLRQLKIEGLGRVNLITGRNNTGKSSVLEALRILSSNGSPQLIYDVLDLREENYGFGAASAPPIADDGRFIGSSIFHGFPRFPEEVGWIRITSNSESEQPKKVSIWAGWTSEKRRQQEEKNDAPTSENSFDAKDAEAMFVIESGTRRSLVRLEEFRRRSFRPEFLNGSQQPCVFVSAYGWEQTDALGALWDKIALSDLEKDVVDALRVLEPEITAVSMVSDESKRGIRIAIVRTKKFPRPIPLRSLGDGLNRLFGIIVSLVNAQGGILLIDEFENGLHHTVQLDTWRAIFKLAERLDIQVFATTHSWDAVEAFQKAASETAEDGVVVRLYRIGEEIIPTVFSKDELEIITHDRMEVR